MREIFVLYSVPSLHGMGDMKHFLYHPDIIISPLCLHFNEPPISHITLNINCTKVLYLCSQHFSQDAVVVWWLAWLVVCLFMSQ